MHLFVGLGNPGRQYAGNRHNIGFMAIDQIAEAHGFGPWRSKGQGLLADGHLGAERLLLLKPKTFMNRSGQSVGAVMRFYRLSPAEVTVFHDELDLAPGKLRVKTGGGLAGHNGLKSICAHIGPGFTRVRIGIGHPGDRALVQRHVLSDFTRAEREGLDSLLRGISQGAPALATGESGRFLNAVALRCAPPPPSTNAKAPATPGPGAGPAKERPRAVHAALQRLKDRFK
ncbi:MAG: aminoacyl-tRNA hydrolase [Rhodobacteraceae bacterium]|nr:aminoacyl-tRNA hydrolase [Paracoccaceae bacterium]